MSNPFEQSEYDGGGGGGGGGASSGGGGASNHGADYNPFSNTGTSAAGSSAASGSARPTTAAPAQFSGGSGSEDLRRKEAELARRAAELDEKERQLKKREAELGAVGYRPPNWPRCKPVLYHDIKEEIPSDLQGMVRAGYFSWIFYCSSMILNWFAVMCYTFNATPSKPDGFIAACFFLLLAPPLAFMMSYQSLYKGASVGKASSLLWYCITQGCSVGVSIFMFIGVPDTGAGGIFVLIASANGKHANAFITTLLGIVTGLWGGCFIFGMYVMRRVWYYYKVQGGPVKAEHEVKAELAKHAISNA